MSAKIQAKKLQETNAAMQRYTTRKSQTLSSGKGGRSQPKQERKAPSKSVSESAAESRVHGSESRRMKDGLGARGLSKHSGKEDGKLRIIKHDGKISSILSPPISQKLNSSVLHVKDGRSGFGLAEEPTSPRSKNITETSSETVLSTSIKTDVSQNASKTKPKGRGKQTSGQVAQKQQEEEKMMLPKITINEVLQSWKIEQPRNRSSSGSGKDPMEFLRRDPSLSESNGSEKTQEDLWKCRYLRLGKEDHDVHGYCCSCNSCEHGDGLRSTAYLNS